MRAAKPFLFLFCLSLFASIPAVADTCNAFASYTCAKSTPDVVNFVGTGTTSQSVNVLLGSNTFSVTIHGNHSFAGDDLVILADRNCEWRLIRVTGHLPRRRSHGCNHQHVVRSGLLRQ